MQLQMSQNSGVSEIAAMLQNADFKHYEISDSDMGMSIYELPAKC